MCGSCGELGSQCVGVAVSWSCGVWESRYAGIPLCGGLQCMGLALCGSCSGQGLQCGLGVAVSGSLDMG